MPVIYKGISMTGLSRTEADNLYAKKEDLDNLETSSKDLSSGTTFIVDLGSSDPPQQDATIEVYNDEFIGFKPEVSDQTHSAIVRCNNELYFASFKVTAVGPESATVKFVEAVSPATNLEDYYDKAAIDKLLEDLSTGDIDLSNYYTKEETYNKEEVDAMLEEVDISGYQTKTEGPEEEVTALGATPESLIDVITIIVPNQEGSGTPYLTNVRNITGWDGVTITHNGESTTRPFSEVVYSGTYDWAKGELTIDSGYIELAVADMNSVDNSPTWNLDYDVNLDIFIENNQGVVDCISNVATRIFIDTHEGSFDKYNRIGLDTPGSLFEENGITIDKIKEQYPDLVCQFVIPLLNPRVVRLTPKEFVAVSGSNTFNSNCGLTKITFKTSLKDLIEAKANKSDLLNYYTKDETDEKIEEAENRLTEEINKRLEGTVQTTDFADLIKIVGAAEGSPLEPTSKIEFVQEGTGTPSLTNVRNIIGWDSIELRHSGKNLLNTTEFHTQANWTSSTTITGGYDYNMTLPKGTYTISFPSDVDASQYLYIFVGGTQTNMIQAGLKMSSYTFTIAEDTTIRIFEFGYSLTSIPDNSPLNKLQIEEGNEETEFEPYTTGIKTYVQTFDNTVYAGTFNWYTGVLTLTHRMFELAVAEMINTSRSSYPGWVNPEGVSECFTSGLNIVANGVGNVGADAGVNTTDSTRRVVYMPSNVYGLNTAEQWKQQHPDLVIQFLFPLLEKTTVKLAKHTISALKGTNVLSSNCGQTSVSYQVGKKDEVDIDLSNYYTKQETYSKEEVDTKFDELELPEGGSGDVFPVKAPVGTIVIWSGTESDIPKGWQLCDGTNNTPDLRDKFVLGAGPGHAVGGSGGEEEVTLTTEQLPDHTHANYVKGNRSPQHPSTDKASVIVPDTTSNVANPQTTSWSITSHTGGGGPHNNMPPYYALCFIMKIKPDETDGGTQFTTDSSLTMTDDNVLGVTTPVKTILTKAEYDVLPEDQRNKGLYVVEESGDNASSGGGGGYSNIYSTEEVVIGEWFGKPLYRVCGSLKIGSLTAGSATKGLNVVLSSVFVDNDFSNITLRNFKCECFDYNGVYVSSDMTQTYNNGSEVFDRAISLYRATNATIRDKTAIIRLYSLISSDTYSNSTLYVTLEYTKTTD